MFTGETPLEASANGPLSVAMIQGNSRGGAPRCYPRLIGRRSAALTAAFRAVGVCVQRRKNRFSYYM